MGGSTGAGKGSVIWSLIRAAAPCVHDGTVQLWCVDPKGGMELSAGQAMFTRFAYDDPAEMADLFDDAADLLRTRAARLRGVTRKHTPSRIEPLVVVVDRPHPRRHTSQIVLAHQALPALFRRIGGKQG